jgi:membrane dipeptidase
MISLPIFDGHNDTLTHLYSLKQQGRSFLKRDDEGHLDLPRAREGMLAGGLFAIWAPPPEGSKERDPYYGLSLTTDGYRVKLHPPLETDYAKKYTEQVIEYLYDMEAEANNQVCLVRTYQELERNIDNGIFSIILHLEGAEALNKDLSDIDSFYSKGVRSVGLVWSRSNAFGNGVPFWFPHSPDTGKGITKAGEDLVRECNRLKIMIDLAHINEKGFWDVAKISRGPLVVSHAGIHKICPSTRNITDKQLDAIAATDGLIGIIFEPSNTKSNGMPGIDTPLSEIIHHIEYAVERVGIDHVAFGSDFDGAEMPKEIHDVTRFPKLIQVLQEKGYDRISLEKIAYRNWFRVIKTTWKD